MKKSLFTILSIFVLTSCFSQSNFSAGFGINYNLAKNKPGDFESKPTFGPMVELNYHHQIGDFILRPGLQAEVIFWEDELPDLIGGAFKTRIAYLNFLPQIDWKLTDRFSIGGGGFYRYRVGEQAFSPLSNSWETSPHFEVYEKSDYGFLLSAQTYFKDFIFGINYMNGLKEIIRYNGIEWTDQNGNLIGRTDPKNLSFQARILYVLD